MKSKISYYVFFHVILVALIVAGTHDIKWAGYVAQAAIFFGTFVSVIAFFDFARKKNCVEYCRRILDLKEQRREEIAYVLWFMGFEAAVLLCDEWIFTALALVVSMLVSFFIPCSAKSVLEEQ